MTQRIAPAAGTPAPKHIRRRTRGYRDAVGEIKGREVTEIQAIGYVLDAIIAEQAARGEFQTAEMQAFAVAFAKVKADNPKVGN